MEYEWLLYGQRHITVIVTASDEYTTLPYLESMLTEMESEI